MDVRILKKPVTFCTICNDVSELRNAWDEGQKLLVDSGEQDEPKSFPGVPGYLIKDNDDYRYSYNEVCEKCMHTLMKGVTIINSQGLTGISLDTNK
jgi:hypothetical protein